MTCRAWQSAKARKQHLEARTGQTIKHPLLPEVGGTDPSKDPTWRQQKVLPSPDDLGQYWS